MLFRYQTTQHLKQNKLPVQTYPVTRVHVVLKMKASNSAQACNRTVVESSRSKFVVNLVHGINVIRAGSKSDGLKFCQDSYPASKELPIGNQNSSRPENLLGGIGCLHL